MYVSKYIVYYVFSFSSYYNYIFLDASVPFSTMMGVKNWKWPLVPHQGLWKFSFRGTENSKEEEDWLVVSTPGEMRVYKGTCLGILPDTHTHNTHRHPYMHAWEWDTGPLTCTWQHNVHTQGRTETVSTRGRTLFFKYHNKPVFSL